MPSTYLFIHLRADPLTFGRVGTDALPASFLAEVVDRISSPEAARHLRLLYKETEAVIFLPVEVGEPFEISAAEPLRLLPSRRVRLTARVGSASALLSELLEVASALAIPTVEHGITDAVAEEVNQDEPRFSKVPHLANARLGWLMAFEGARLALRHRRAFVVHD